MQLSTTPLAGEKESSGLSVNSWLKEAAEHAAAAEKQDWDGYLEKNYDAITGMGWIKHAFVFSFYELLKAS